MLKCIEIKNLFGRFNYTLDFEGKNIVILTGPNGFGKLTILQIIDAIANDRIFYLLKIEFKEIRFYFVCNNKDVLFTIAKKDGNLYIDNLPIKFEGRWKNINKIINNLTDIYSKERKPIDEKYLHDFDFFFEKIIDEKFENIRQQKATKNDFRQRLNELINNLGDVRIISEQRLLKKKNLNEKNEEIVDVVLHLPGELKKKISKEIIKPCLRAFFES